VVLHRHKKAWGLFWAGGGLNQCRDELTKQMGSEASTSAIVPATPDALLRLILTLEEPEVEPVLSSKPKKQKMTGEEELSPERVQTFPWGAVALTSAVWLTVLVVLGVSLTSQIQRQDQRLQQLIERIELK
jgi:hypothetical protein